MEDALAALEADMARIVAAGVETARRAGVAPDQADVVYLTGGFTGLLPLATHIAAPSPKPDGTSRPAIQRGRAAELAC